MHVETPLAHNWPGGEGLHWVLWWLELHLWIFEVLKLPWFWQVTIKLFTYLWEGHYW